MGGVALYDLTSAIGISSFFGIWALLFNVSSIVYIINVLTWKDSFQIRVREPALMILELVTLQISLTAVFLREFLTAWGLELPCQVADFAYVQLMTAYIIILPLRSIQLIVIFDSTARKTHYKTFKSFRTILYGLVPMIFVAFYGSISVAGLKGCHYMCVGHSDAVVYCTVVTEKRFEGGGFHYIYIATF